jgi:hypothetical protein
MRTKALVCMWFLNIIAITWLFIDPKVATVWSAAALIIVGLSE